MSLNVRFELLEIYPPVNELSHENEDLALIFSYDTQELEENVAEMISSTRETSALELDVNLEMKIVLTLYKSDELLGIGEFLIGKSSVQKKEENIVKWVSIKNAFNETSYKKTDNLALNLINAIRLRVKAVPEYNPTKTSIPKTQKQVKKTTTNPSGGDQMTATGENFSRSIKSASNPIKAGKEIKDPLKENMQNNPINSTKPAVSKGGNIASAKTNISNKIPKRTRASKVEPKIEDEDITLSDIDDIFKEEEELQDSQGNMKIISNKFDSVKEEFDSYYTSDYIGILPNDESSLKFEIKMLFDKMIDLQESYHSDLNEAVNKFHSFKTFYSLYADKYLLMNKKVNKFKQSLERTNVKDTVETFIRNQENFEMKDILTIQKKELGLFKSLMNIEYTNLELNEFPVKACSNQKKLMDIAKIIFKREDVLKSLTDVQKAFVNRILKKHEDASNLEATLKIEECKNLTFEGNDVVNNDMEKESSVSVDAKLKQELEELCRRKNYALTLIEFHKVEGSSNIYIFGSGVKCDMRIERGKIIVKCGKSDGLSLEVFIENNFSKLNVSKKKEQPIKKIGQSNPKVEVAHTKMKTPKSQKI